MLLTLTPNLFNIGSVDYQHVFILFALVDDKIIHNAALFVHKQL